MIWVRKLSESSFMSVSPNETRFTQFPNLKSLDFSGVFDFSVIDMGSPWTGVSVLSTTERKRGADIHCNGPKDYKGRHATKSSYHMGLITLSAPLHIDYKDILYANKPVNICWASLLLFTSG